VKLAEAYGGVGIRCDKPSELDGAIAEMLKADRPVLFDCRVERAENCLPMIPSGKAHNEMICRILRAIWLDHRCGRDGGWFDRDD
jgi:acetolactate synthase-1/2/3 large subunit